MNRTLMKLMASKLIALTGVALLSAGVALAQDSGAVGDPSQAQAQGARTDGQIEMDVVHALDASAALKNDLITAATIQGQVTLSGTVSTDASRKLAEQIVSHVDGVTGVRNNLQVGNPGADGQNPQPAPDQEMPDADQSQAQNGMSGLPPPGPSPDQQGQAPNQPAPSIAQNPPSQYPQQPYPQQQPYPPPPPQRPQYGYPQQQYQPQAPSYQIAGGPVTMLQGTVLQ
jgi:hypothetical protein